MIINIYLSRLILHRIGVVDYGINNVVAGFVSMFSFLNASLTASIQRSYNYQKGLFGDKGVQEVYVVSLIIQLISTIIVVLLLESVGLWYIYNELVIPLDRLDAAVIVFHLTVISTAFVIMQVPFSAAVISHEHMDFYAIVSILNAIIRLGLVLAMPLFSSDRLVIYGIIILVATIVDTIMYFCFCKIKLPQLRINNSINKNLLKDVTGFTGWNTLGAFAFMLKDQGINMVLNMFFGPVVNAARGISYQIQAALRNLVPGVITAARPQVVESYAKNDTDRVSTIFFFTSKICFSILYMAVLPVAMEINLILKIWLGENVPEYTAVFTIIVLMISLIDMLNAPISMVMLASGRIKWYNSATSFIGLITIPLTYFALKWGASPYVAFLVSLITTLANQTTSVYIMGKETGITVLQYVKNILYPLMGLIAITMLPAIFICNFIKEGYSRLCLVLVIMPIITIITIYYVLLGNAERISLGSIIKNKFQKNKQI